MKKITIEDYRDSVTDKSVKYKLKSPSFFPCFECNGTGTYEEPVYHDRIYRDCWTCNKTGDIGFTRFNEGYEKDQANQARWKIRDLREKELLGEFEEFLSSYSKKDRSSMISAIKTRSIDY